MRTTKAYLAGLGTTGALVATTLLLLVLGSGLVAFDGGPSLNGDEGRLYPAVGAGRAHAPGGGHSARANRARRARRELRAALESAAGTPSAGQTRLIALGTPRALGRPVTTRLQRNTDRRRTAVDRDPVVTFRELGGGAGVGTGRQTGAEARSGGTGGGAVAGGGRQTPVAGGGREAPVAGGGTPVRVADRGARGGGGVFAED